MDDAACLADDLTGAAEVAVALRAAAVRLGPAPAAAGAVVDLDSREVAPEEAVRRLRAGVAGARRVLKKIDSSLRGNVAAEVAALAAGGAPVVVATALPVLGRTCVAGVVHVDGVPLHATELWAAERTAPPRSIAAALGAEVTHAGLDAVRSGELALARAITVCDAETDADLDAIAAAAWEVPDARVVGAAGIAAAIGRRLGRAPLPGLPPPSGRPVLVVLGTAAAVLDEQLARLGERDGATVLRAGGPGELGALAEAVQAAGDGADLVLSGGETARAVLDALGVRTLEPLGEVHHGAVLSRTPDGRRVVTRPGGFGGPDSLVDIVAVMLGA